MFRIRGYSTDGHEPFSVGPDTGFDDETEASEYALTYASGVTGTQFVHEFLSGHNHFVVAAGPDYAELIKIVEQ